MRNLLIRSTPGEILRTLSKAPILQSAPPLIPTIGVALTSLRFSLSPGEKFRSIRSFGIHFESVEILFPLIHCLRGNLRVHFWLYFGPERVYLNRFFLNFPIARICANRKRAQVFRTVLLFLGQFCHGRLLRPVASTIFFCLVLLQHSCLMGQSLHTT